MIHADDINNTALYGFHPDFVREENKVTPLDKKEPIEDPVDETNLYFSNILLSVLIGVMLMLFVLPRL